MIVLVINILPSKRPEWLPKRLKNWDYLPLWMHSLSIRQGNLHSCFCIIYQKNQIYKSGNHNHKGKTFHFWYRSFEGLTLLAVVVENVNVWMHMIMIRTLSIHICIEIQMVTIIMLWTRRMMKEDNNLQTYFCVKPKFIYKSEKMKRKFYFHVTKPYELNV